MSDMAINYFKSESFYRHTQSDLRISKCFKNLRITVSKFTNWKLLPDEM